MAAAEVGSKAVVGARNKEAEEVQGEGCRSVVMPAE